MSIQSKARREAKKRKAVKARNRATPMEPEIEPHADLRNLQGDLLAGIVRRSDVWVLGMHGRIVGSSDSAAQVLVMIKRIAALHEAKGEEVRLQLSDELRGNAELEAAMQGLELDVYEKQLEAEMQEDASAIDGDGEADAVSEGGIDGAAHAGGGSSSTTH